jgi:hypothetical protein
MEVAKMTENKNETFVLVKDANGENILCPMETFQDASSLNPDEFDDCVGEEVVRRYAGNIKIKSN